MKKFFFHMDSVLVSGRREGIGTAMLPERNMLEALSLLLDNGGKYGISVCVLTEVNPRTNSASVREKLEWRDAHMPLLFDSEFMMLSTNDEGENAVEDMLQAGISEDYFLIDRNGDSLSRWHQAGGCAVKYEKETDAHPLIGNRLRFDMTGEEIYAAILLMAGVTSPLGRAA